MRQIRPHFPIYARSTIQQANAGCLRETVNAAKDICSDSISFLAVDTSSQAFNRDLIWPIPRQAEIGIASYEAALLEEELELLIAQNVEDFASGYIVENPEKLRRIVSYFRRILGELPLLAPMCNAPWVSAVVEVDGAIRPCFFHKKIGSTELLPLHLALNTSEAKAFRQVLDVKSNPTCQRCVCSLNYDS
ncbi:radical SAM/SPASM domain-containing protein [Edaphobacter albus]|uniref:radical SAM/SPASM domain-containing protein n=1 Tax=Edaphobacter sp. 4G125 TaxID=2763071 RepID=UPI002106E952|nr:SPASM domain-containing protein [Edaphobacter sp. 4G125]